MTGKTKIWKIIVYLSVFGIVLASYLFYNFLIHPITQLCHISVSVNCDAVTIGPISTLFGMPVSLIGLTGYIVILISSIKRLARVLLGMSAFGTVFCLYITYQELFIIKVICPVCLTCQIVMLIIFLLAVKLNLKKRR